MKKVAAAVVIGALGFAGAAFAADTPVASHVFTWSGSVPASSTAMGYIIKATDGGEIQNGALIFSADDAGKGNLLGASSLDFNVFHYVDDVVGQPVTSYNYEMTSLASSKGGLVTEQDANGYFKITADGVDLAKNDVQEHKMGPTVLTVAAADTAEPSNQPNAGDDVAVQASVVVIGAI